MKVIKGRTASRGKVSGKIKVIKRYDDIFNIEEGDIVVAESIHPDMSPILLKIKGIITEENSLLQHACIVAREFCIPCIVGVNNCTKIFRNGEVVDLDANSGSITKS